MNLCQNCGKETKNDKYCSRSCAATRNNAVSPKRQSAKKKSCAACGVTTKNTRYCSNACQQKSVSDEYISSWISGDLQGTTPSGYLSARVRTWLLKNAEYKCEQCGWDKINAYSGKSPLEIDHINGDHADNRVENLRVLCPNCHALTPTWKALNSNSNRQRLGTFPKLERERARERKI